MLTQIRCERWAKHMKPRRVTMVAMNGTDYFC